MFRARGSWVRFSEPFKLLRTTPFCSNAKSSSSSSSSNPTTNNQITGDERYRQLENLDFMTAAKILFTDLPKKKKFGIDFHLVQLFFACLPSLAVYLVAQYARYDIRKMEAEVEQKRKQKVEQEAKEKEKEMELNPPKEKEEKSDPHILEVKVRLDKLEEAVKEIVAETKKQSSSSLAENQASNDEKKHGKSSTASNMNSGLTSNKAVEKDNLSKHDSVKPKPELGQESVNGSMAAPKFSLDDQKGQNQDGGASKSSRM